MRSLVDSVKLGDEDRPLAKKKRRTRTMVSMAVILLHGMHIYLSVYMCS